MPHFPQAFTHMPPGGWIRDASGVPDAANPAIGIEEWKGWSFADEVFWITVAGGDRPSRALFTRASGTVAVADPDQWNDQGNPADFLGFYGTSLSFTVPLGSHPPGNQLKLKFNSSWVGECCDDGDFFDPDGNNQTALLTVSYNSGPPMRLLQWESAPFIDNNGDPSVDPNDTPNPFYRPNNADEIVVLELNPPGGALTAEFEFSVLNAGDDGWWAFDNAEVSTFACLEIMPGDMDCNCDLNMQSDIEWFVLGLRDPELYREQTYWWPSVRGSETGDILDYNEIPWFLSLFEEQEEALGLSAAEVLSAALNGVPEPSTLALLLMLGVGLSRLRVRAVAAQLTEMTGS
jgi:hypothetical protein